MPRMQRPKKEMLYNITWNPKLCYYLEKAVPHGHVVNYAYNGQIYIDQGLEGKVISTTEE